MSVEPSTLVDALCADRAGVQVQKHYTAKELARNLRLTADIIERQAIDREVQVVMAEEGFHIWIAGALLPSEVEAA